MREIKFRIWDNVNKIMVDEPHIIFPDNDGYFWREVANGKIRSDLEGDLLQFTGLHDKNGKEIYEGDIVKDPDATEPEDLGWEVYWNDTVAGFEFICLRLSLDGSRGSWMPNFDAVAGTFKIIGNIYEPPHH